MFILSCLDIFFLFSGGSYRDQTEIFDYNVKKNHAWIQKVSSGGLGVQVQSFDIFYIFFNHQIILQRGEGFVQ